MTQLFDVGTPTKWLDPTRIDQNNPAQWHAALVAIIGLRMPEPHENWLYVDQHVRSGYAMALRHIHTIIAGELGVESTP